MFFLRRKLKPKKMNYTGAEEHAISLNDAAELTQRFRDNLPVIDYTIAEYFGKLALLDLLNQSSCVGVRIYYGIDANMEKKLVIVGVDSNGDDLYNGDIMEAGSNCPPNCSSNNPLNSV